MEEAVHGAGHEAHQSKIPVWIAVAALALYLGLGWWDSHAFGKVLLGAGLVAFLGTTWWWAHHDIRHWPSKEHHLSPIGGHRDVAFYGMIFFLATEVMLFAALFTYWFVNKAFSERWEPPHGIDLPLGITGLNTAFLLSSGATFHWGYLGLKKGNQGRFKTGLLLTILLGGLFLGLQVNEYATLAREGMVIGSDAYSSTFFTLTGTHGFHVALGLLLLLLVMGRALVGQFNPDKYLFVEATGMYWHFVDAVWVVLFSTVYLEVI